jgi:hypothetical protein
VITNVSEEHHIHPEDGGDILLALVAAYKTARRDNPHENRVYCCQALYKLCSNYYNYARILPVKNEGKI